MLHGFQKTDSVFVYSNTDQPFYTGAATHTHMQTDILMYRIALVLALMLATSLAGILTLALMERPVPELLFVLGSVSGSGLARLLIPSPWNRLRRE